MKGIPFMQSKLETRDISMYRLRAERRRARRNAEADRRAAKIALAAERPATRRTA